MILAKLMATLAASMAPAAYRSAAMSASAQRERAFFKLERSCSIPRCCGADHFQHVVHRRLALGCLVTNRVEQRFHAGKILARQRLDGATQGRPVACELFGEIDFPRLRFALHSRAGVEHDLLQNRGQRVEPRFAYHRDRDDECVIGHGDHFEKIVILNDTKTESPEIVPSMVPWSSAGTTSESGMPIPVAPSFAIFCRSSSVPLMRNFLPLKSESRRIGFFAP